MNADVVICGAGIAGISAAYSLAVEKGIRNVLLVDERPPLSLTSDQSTECYRNWWPDPAMVALINRSIDRMEMLASATGNRFNLNRRGYLYCTADPQTAVEMERSARRISAAGAGELRVHPVGVIHRYIAAEAEGFESSPIGADLLLDPALIHAHFPYLAPGIVAALHVRRAGWFSGQQLGMALLEEARRHGVQVLAGQVTGVDRTGGRVAAVRLADGTRLHAPVFVNAAGPFLEPVGRLLEIDLPVYNELHLKLAMKDPLAVLQRRAPLVILADAQRLPWTDEERRWLADEPDGANVLELLPPGLHLRPEGGAGSTMILALWEYHTRVMQPLWPLPVDPFYPEVILRGLAQLLPGMAVYINKTGKPRIDGGYYTRTIDNLPLIDRLPLDGTYVIGALSGFGLMAACGAGELIAARINGEVLPAYAEKFSLARLDDPETIAAGLDRSQSGQL